MTFDSNAGPDREPQLAATADSPIGLEMSRCPNCSAELEFEIAPDAAFVGFINHRLHQGRVLLRGPDDGEYFRVARFLARQWCRVRQEQAA